MSGAKIQIPPPKNVKFTKSGRAYAEMSTLIEGELYERIREALQRKRNEAAANGGATTTAENNGANSAKGGGQPG